MPLHKSFFPESPSAKKTVNETVNIPRPMSEPATLIKSDYKPTPKVEVITKEPLKESVKSKPVEYAPPPVILPKKNIFFNMY